MKPTRLVLPTLILLILSVTALQGAEQTPHWIWHSPAGATDKPEVRFFRHAFQVTGTPSKAVLTAAGDDDVQVYLNGAQVANSRNWNRPATVNVTSHLKPGTNLLAARGRNGGGEAGMIVKLDLTFPDGKKQLVVSDTNWLAAAEDQPNWFSPETTVANWARATSRGALGAAPWGDVMAPRLATSAKSLTLLPGFKAELIRSAEADEGSWVCLALDPKGRLIISPQEGKGNMLRVTLKADGQIDKMETIDLAVGGAMGLLYAFDSLYVSGAGPNGLGLYRLKDTNGDDRFDALELLKKFDGAGGEHGSHALALGPDQMIYYMHGNFVKLPPDLSAESPHRNYREDQLLPRGDDGNGFGVGILPPGGFVLRTDRDAKKWEMVAGGMRNTYDFAFNSDGEMFGFDSDMEWDWGMPWYRPTRILHLVSAGDYGFREGTGKWPVYYPDSLPPVVDIGVGSPTGVKFGTGSKFPSKYQKALFAMDWSYGRILAVHLQPNGASYTGTYEAFVQGKPLNVTDLEFGQDGAMYFLTGGRGTQSGLYRVTYQGTDTGPAPAARQSAGGAAEARALRHKLEAFHGKKDPAAIDAAWPHLDSNDRWIRYAARCAIESQDVALWQRRALMEERLNASLTALLALARCGSPQVQNDLLTALGRYPASQLNDQQKLEALRVLALSFIRLGKPDPGTAEDVIEVVDPLYPSGHPAVDRELAQILIYLESPKIVEKTLKLAERASTLEDQIHYIFHLRTLKTGWTIEQRRRYLTWFNQNHDQLGHPPELLRGFQEAGREYAHGASYPRFLANFRKQSLSTLSAREQESLADVIASAPIRARPPPAQRSFVKEWKMEELMASLGEKSRRSFDNGKKVFTDAQCLACHRFGNEGGAVGPDLTAVSSRFARRDLLEATIDPSKVVSDQYQNTWILTRDGNDVIGRVVEETGDTISIRTNPYTEDKTVIKKSEIQQRQASKISPMPEGLLNVFTRDEILDLLAYLESGGKKEHSAFQ